MAVDASGHSYFDADLPIHSRADDRLGRRVFADSVAEQLATVPAESGFTMAITGPWGSGKSSVLNMIRESLAEQDGTRIEFVQFNPWLISGTVDLVGRFFEELSAQMGRSEKARLRSAASAMAGFGERVSGLVPGGEWAKLASSGVNAWAAPPSLVAQKDELADRLRKAKIRVVVFVDDIDRLEDEEICQLIRATRLVSTLPNLVFLLAFDRERVAKSLGEEDGHEYLNKIVQVSHDLPKAQEAILPSLFSQWLDLVVEGRELQTLDKNVWSSVFPEIIRPLLGNLRDVKRYLNSVQLALDLVGNEVALADLLGIEAVRILRPNLIAGLQENAAHLVHGWTGEPNFLPEEQRAADSDAAFSDILERAGSDRAILVSVLDTLFPAAKYVGSRGGYGPEWDATWRGQRRIASADVLRIYLQRGLSKGNLSSSNIQELLVALTDGFGLSELLAQYDGAELENVLERLADFEKEFPPEAAATATPVVLNLMGRLSKRAEVFFGIAPRMVASRLILRLLRKVEGTDELANVVRSMWPRIESLSAKFELVEILGHRKGAGHRLVDEESAHELEALLLVEIVEASAEELAAEWDLGAMLIRALAWFEGAQREEARARMAEHLGNSPFVVTLLVSVLGEDVSSDGSRKPRLPWDLLIERTSDGLMSAVKDLSSGAGLSEREAAAVELAQKYADGWRPPKNPWDDED